MFKHILIVMSIVTMLLGFSLMTAAESQKAASLEKQYEEIGQTYKESLKTIKTREAYKNNQSRWRHKRME